MRSTSDLYAQDVASHDFEKLTQAQLVDLHRKATVEGDLEAWQTLWLHGVRLVLKIANAMRNVGQIVTQDVYNECLSAGNLAIGEALLTWRPKKGRFSTWVWLQIRYAILAEIDREVTQGGKGHEYGQLLTNLYEGSEDWETFLEEVETDEHQGLWYLDITRIREALPLLPEREAAYLRRVYVEGELQTDVAADEDISVQAVHKVLRRGIDRLRELFGE